MTNNPNTDSFPVLKTERLDLSELKMSDNKEIFFLRSSDIVMRYIKRNKLIKLEEANTFVKRIEKDLSENKIFYWAVRLKGESKLIGTICLWNFSQSKKIAEIGYDLNPKFHKEGIMHEAMIVVLKFGFSNGFHSIEAYTNKENKQSVKLLINNGFILSKNKIDKGNINNIIFTKHSN